MKEIDIDELKSIQVEILLKVATFCESNKLLYHLAGGTLLGSIRHNGYIPWDDDIDIMMPRKDYTTFIQTFNGCVENLVVDSPELHRDYYAPYANVYNKQTLLIEDYLNHGKREIGVKIDIFPVDHVPSYTVVYKSLSFVSRVLCAFCNYKNQKVSFYSGTRRLSLIVKKILLSPIPFSVIQEIHIQLLKLSNKFSDNTYSDFIVFPAYGPKRIEDKYVYPLAKHIFEGHSFNVPGNYDKYLSNIFGDYMKLPPVEKRVAHHYFKAYWK